MKTKDFSGFEKKIGYKFKDTGALKMALTHSSCNKEKNTKHQDNERLEFLGDAFLDAIIGEELFRRLPQGSEDVYKRQLLNLVFKSFRAVLHQNQLQKCGSVLIAVEPYIAAPISPVFFQRIVRVETAGIHVVKSVFFLKI